MPSDEPSLPLGWNVPTCLFQTYSMPPETDINKRSDEEKERARK